MRNEYVIDTQQFVELQVSDPGSRIDQNVIINQQGSRALVAPANSATAAQNPHLHLVPMEFRDSCSWTIRPGTGK
ncbi:hypothetical protein [Zoogloea sp.]|uniref:hypothetical protein n=1 Tax=Zoogloea sp. TaxID=49181 RepID=UPI0026115A6C|nr:hypothetical protein [Zoogloea sp.]